MDDTTHPCFCSRCMVWSLLVESWYYIIFSDVKHAWIQTKLRRKSCQIPKQVKAGLWHDGMTGWSMGWSLWMEMVKSQQQTTYTRCNKKCSMEKQFWRDLKRLRSWRTNHFTVILFCFNFGVVCFVCLSSFVFLSLRQKIPAKICQARRCPPLWIWQPLLWVLAFSRYRMFLGGIWNWVTELAPARNPQEI